MDKSAPESPAIPRVDRCDDADRTRLMLAAFAEYFLNVCRLRAPLYNGDTELALIADAVGLHAIQTSFADPKLRKKFSGLSVKMGEQQDGCSILWVAKTTGLPRETVRRKLNQLVDMGILHRREDGEFVYRTGVLLQPAYLEVVKQIEAESIRFFNQCLSDRVVVLSVD